MCNQHQSWAYAIRVGPLRSLTIGLTTILQGVGRGAWTDTKRRLEDSGASVDLLLLPILPTMSLRNKTPQYLFSGRQLLRVLYSVTTSPLPAGVLPGPPCWLPLRAGSKQLAMDAVDAIIAVSFRPARRGVRVRDLWLATACVRTALGPGGSRPLAGSRPTAPVAGWGCMPSRQSVVEGLGSRSCDHPHAFACRPWLPSERAACALSGGDLSLLPASRRP